MPCVYKPNYLSYDFLNQDPAYQWGLGRAAGYIHFDQNEFKSLEGESQVSWDINFKDKIRGRNVPNPHSLIAENRNHVYHNNILRGSRWMAEPVQLFNGAVYNEKVQSDNSAVAITQAADQGLMFFWDDFKGDYGTMTNGSVVTMSVEIRTTNTEVPLQQAVRIKTTPNFDISDRVTTQEIGNGWTRIIFRTKMLNVDWKAPANWSEIWGVENKEPSPLAGRTWDKNNLMGIVQNIDNVQLEWTRPMISLEASTTYEEAGMDAISKNVFSWNGMVSGKRLLNAGTYVDSNVADKKLEWANPTFFAVPSGNNWQGIATFMVAKFTKTPFTLSTNIYGKVCWYSGASESAAIGYNLFSSEDGKYGGELSLITIPEGATHYRIHVTGASQQAVEFKMGFNDISYVNNSSASAELKQLMYDGVMEDRDSKVARVYADNYNERVKVDYRINLIAELLKVFPNIFDGLTTIEQKVTRIKSIFYSLEMTATVRGHGARGYISWHQKRYSSTDPSGGTAVAIKDFGSESFQTFTYRTDLQDFVDTNGHLYGYFFTYDPTPADREQAWIEIDFLNFRLTTVQDNSSMDAWNFNSEDSKYNKTSVDQLMMRTEDNMLNSSVQVTHGYDIYGIVNSTYPEFFGDCYTYEDCISKLNERIESFTFNIESVIPDPDTNGLGYVNVVLEASEPVRDFNTVYNKNETHTVVIHNGLSKFVKPNGYIYLGMERPPEDSNIELGMNSDVTFQLKMDRDYDNNKRIFRYNKKKQPWFLFVRDIQRSVLPPKINHLVDTNKGRTRYNYGQTEDARSITLKCFIKAPSEVEVDRLAEELADYLDVGETILQLYDAPEREYKVILDGETNIRQTLHMGEIDLNFILLDNYAIGKEVVEEDTFNNASATVPFIELNNQGTADTYPKYILDFTSSTGFVDLIGQEDSANISIGRRQKTGAAETQRNLRPQEFYSSFDSKNGVTWENLTSATLPNIEEHPADIQGTTIWDRGMAYMKNWDYGKGTYWHGNGKLAPLNHNVTNFQAEFSTALYGTPKPQMLGGLWLIFYDAAKNPIVKVKLGTRPQDGHLDSYITTAADNKPRTLINQGSSKLWDNFQGKVIVERKDNRWKLTVGQFRNRTYSPAPESSFAFGSAMLKDVKSTAWVDLGNTTWDKDIAYVGVFIGTYGTRPKLSHISGRRLIIWENLDDTLATPTEEPIVFQAGDQVVIDSEKGQAYLNGVITPRLIDPMTDWFPVRKGNNIIGVNNFQGKITTVYNERFK